MLPLPAETLFMPHPIPKTTKKKKKEPGFCVCQDPRSLRAACFQLPDPYIPDELHGAVENLGFWDGWQWLTLLLHSKHCCVSCILSWVWGYGTLTISRNTRQHARDILKCSPKRRVWGGFHRPRFHSKDTKILSRHGWLLTWQSRLGNVGSCWKCTGAKEILEISKELPFLLGNPPEILTLPPSEDPKVIQEKHSVSPPRFRLLKR